MIFATIPEFGSTCKRVFRLEGAMAQLVAHLLCKQRVAGSSPASSTNTDAPALCRGTSVLSLGTRTREGWRGEVALAPSAGSLYL